MGTFAGPLGSHEIVVANETEQVGAGVARMAGQKHVRRQPHLLVMPHPRPSHQVQTLTVTIEPQLGRHPCSFEVVAIGLIDLAAGGARLELRHGLMLGFATGSEGFTQLAGGLAEYNHARQLGIIAGRAVVLDQQRELIAASKPPPLQMLRQNWGGMAGTGRAAQKNAVAFAANPIAFVARQRGYLDVAHPGTYLREQALKHLVLHPRGLLDSSDLFGALDSLALVQELGFIAPRYLRAQDVAERADKAKRHRSSARQRQLAIAAAANDVGNDFRLVGLGVLHRSDRRSRDM